MPTPNDDRSRSKNDKDPVGQAAEANHQEQVKNRDASEDATQAPPEKAKDKTD